MDNRSRLHLLLALLLTAGTILLSACSDTPVAPQETRDVSGRILDRTGNMVPNAIVTAVSSGGARLAIDTTDELGGFLLDAIPFPFTGVRIGVEAQGIRSINDDLIPFIATAGGENGLALVVDGEDSCCNIVRVAATSNGSALSGVRVQLRTGRTDIRTGITGDDGSVLFRGICDGEYNVRLSRDGYAVAERGDINLDNCDSSTANLAMTANSTGGGDSCCNGVATISVTDSASGSAINEAEVRLTRVGGNARTLRTENGSTTFRELCRGLYNVRIARSGYRVVEYQLELGCDDTLSDSRRLAANATSEDTCCRGRAYINVRDGNGNAVNDVRVRLWRGGQLLSTRESNTSGLALFENLCSGNYGVDITRDGFVTQEFTFEIGCNGTVERNRTLERTSEDSCCGGRLQVIVRDSTSGTVLANATVRLWRGSTQIGSRTTNANGVAVFEELCEAENYSFNVSRDGYTSRETSNFAITCNQNREYGFRLLSTNSGESCCSASLLLRVREDGMPTGWIQGATVQVRHADTVVAEGTTNGDGVYLREELCGNRTYVIRISKDGFVTRSITITYTTCRRAEETVVLARQ